MSGSSTEATGFSNLPLPEWTSLAHALRWVDTGERFLSIVDQVAVGDFPDVEADHLYYSKKDLLLALRHGAISAKGYGAITSRELLDEDGLVATQHLMSFGCEHWHKFIASFLPDYGRHEFTSRNVGLVSIPPALWHTQFVSWPRGWMVYVDEDCEVMIMDIEVSGTELSKAFRSSMAKTFLSVAEDTNRMPSLHPREHDSLLKLVIGMAVEQYGYDPEAARGTAIRDIASDLELRGVSLDHDTIRKHLRRAAELLPPKDTD